MPEGNRYDPYSTLGDSSRYVPVSLQPHAKVHIGEDDYSPVKTGDSICPSLLVARMVVGWCPDSKRVK